MELHQLRYVVAVAQTGSFSRAAERCHVSQPTLSQQVQKLEDELSERLFVRMKRLVKPTPHGEAFLPRAVRILEEVEAARRDANDAKNLLCGTVTVGVLPTIAPYVLPRVISEFVRKFPGMDIVAHEDTTAQLLALALAREIDFALASKPISDLRLEIRELFSEELLVALPLGHALATKRSVTIADLEKEPLIVMKEGHCLGEQVIRFCEQRDLRPRIRFRSAQLETIQALVRAGHGISLVPRMAAKQDRSDMLVYRSLVSSPPQRNIVAVWPRLSPLGRAANEFLKLLAQAPVLGKGDAK